MQMYSKNINVLEFNYDDCAEIIKQYTPCTRVRGAKRSTLQLDVIPVEPSPQTTAIRSAQG